MRGLKRKRNFFAGHKVKSRLITKVLGGTLLFKKNAAFAAVLALIVSIVVPSGTFAYDPGNIVKTVSVKSSDGASYSGAVVALTYLADNGDLLVTSPVTTNANGIAALTVPGAVEYVGLAIAPTSADTTHGLVYLDPNAWPDSARTPLLAWSQSFDVTLPTAEVFITPYLGVTGTTPAPIGSSFWVYTTDSGRSLVLPRTGKVGVSITDAPGADGTADIEIAASSSAYVGEYGSFQVTSGVTSLNTENSDPLTMVGSSYVMRLKQTNVQGVVKSSQGQTISLPEGVEGRVRFLETAPENPSEPSQWGWPPATRMASDGSFGAHLHNLPTGSNVVAVVPQVFFTGHAEWPSFLGETLWVDSTGRFSTNQNMSSPSATATINMPDAAEITLVLETVRKGTTDSDPAFLEIASGEEPYVSWGRNYSSNGIAAYVLPSEAYTLFVDPIAAARPMGQFEIRPGSGSDPAFVLESFGHDGGILDPIETTPLTYRVHGEANDDLRVIGVHPITGEYLDTRGISAIMHWWPEENSKLGRGFPNRGYGFMAVELPNDGEFLPNRPIELSMGPSQDSNLDPLLASKTYTVVMDPTEPFGFAVLSDGVTLSPVSEFGGSPTYALELGYANVYGNIVDVNGDALVQDWMQDQFINGQVQRQDQYSNWQYYEGSHFTVRRDGFFGMELPNGTYRIQINPEGYADYAKTTTPSFTISDANPTRIFEDFELDAPLFAVSVVVPGSTSPLVQANVEIRSQSANVYEWFNAGQVGRAGIVIEDGTYDLVVHPPHQGVPGFTKKTYELTIATVGSTRTVTIKDNGVALSASLQNSSLFLLPLQVPNLSGRVLDPSGNPVRYTQVVPVDPVTGWDLWEMSVNTDQNGRWSMWLPEGEYDIYARAPWGSSSLGNSNLFAGIEVLGNGTVDASTLPGSATAMAWDISLTPPQWTGWVVSPADSNQRLTNVEVCLFGPSRGQCSQVDSSGAFALSKPAGFAGFGGGWELLVREYFDADFSEKRYRTEAEIESVLGDYVAGQVNTNRELTLGVPNVSLRIMAGSEPASNVWVSIDQAGRWLGGATTDQDGYAKFDVEDTVEPINVRAEASHNPQYSSNFSSTMRELEFGDLNEVDGLYSSTISLEVPNFRGIVKTPNGSGTVQNSWVELFDADTNRWIAGASSNQSGAFSLRVPTSSDTVIYELRVNPGHNQQGASARSTFDIEIEVNGTITVEKSGVTVSPNSPNGPYDLRLSTPSVTGKVVDPDLAAVRDSWVVPIDSATGWQLWELGTNSNEQGEFGMALNDGNYFVEARVPWHLTGLAASARCEVTVSSGQMAVNDPDCADSGSLQLKLREPNLKFTLTKDVGGTATPVPFAGVGVRVGNYSLQTQADRDGLVSLFLDEDQMFEAADKAWTEGWLRDNNLSDGIDIPLTFWVDPPWGDSEIVRWECETGSNEPLCGKVGLVGLSNTNTTGDPSLGTWSWTAPGDLGDVAFKTPNTRMTVYYPGGVQDVGEGAWVSLFKERVEQWGTWREWIGGGTTNRDGVASFNISAEDQSSTFTVEIHAPWDERNTYPSRMFSNVTLDTTSNPFIFVRPGSGQFVLPTKNLSLAVSQADSAGASKWAWVGIETVTRSGGVTSYDWLSGAGTDERGRAAVYIEPTLEYQFKLTVYPGPGSKGTRYSCFLEFDPNNPEVLIGAAQPLVTGGVSCDDPAASTNLLEVTLSDGNTRGKVVNSASAAVAGAIVVAESNGTVLTSTTNARGEFFLDLDVAQGPWTIKVLYVNPSDQNPFLHRKDSNATTLTNKDDSLTVDLTNPSSAVLKLNSSVLISNVITLYRSGE